MCVCVSATVNHRITRSCEPIFNEIFEGVGLAYILSAPPVEWEGPCREVIFDSALHDTKLGAPCGLRGCKNGPAPFPGRMSYKATKPGLVSVLYLSMFFIVLLFIRAPFYVLLVFIVCILSFGCSS